VRLVFVELEKLRTVRSTWVLFACGVLLTLPLTVVALLQSTSLRTAPDDVLGLVVLPAVFAASIAVLASAREFEHRTIAVSFALEPRRERVIAAKAAAAALIGAAMAALAVAFSTGIAAVWLSSSGAPWPWTVGETAQGLAGAVLLVAIVAVGGTGFGALTRHVGIAITLLLGIYVALEGLLAGLLAVWRDYGPTAAAAVLTQPATGHAYPFAAALALASALAGLHLAAGVVVVRRCDV